MTEARAVTGCAVRRPCLAAGFTVFAAMLCAQVAAPLSQAVSPGGAPASAPPCASDATTIRAARLLDGRGGSLAHAVVTVRDGIIAAVAPCTGPVTYDLGDATLLPGLIDVHVHLDWHFEPDGRFWPRPGSPPSTEAERSAAILENSRRTLEAGFTTVQALGSPIDLALRNAIASGQAAGPRIITSAGQLQPGSASPDQVREAVRAFQKGGADVIKVIAPEGLTGSDALRRMDAQLSAICDEARTLGLRSVIHAQDPPGIRAAVSARCSQIEHGLFADEEAIRAMANAGVYFDPNIGLNMQNYLEHRAAFLGAPGYTEERFRLMTRIVPALAPLFRRALDARVKMPLGSDAVAGAHGRNAQEIVARVRDGRQRPADAIISATSLAAESLGLGMRIGTLAPGFEADLVAVPGDPMRDVRVMAQVHFVMQGGRVRKAPGP